MPNSNINNLTAATTPVAGTELVPIWQSSATVKVSIDNLTAGKSVSALNFIPSGSSAPTNGMFLPTTNTLGWSTNSTERIRVDSSGNVGIGTNAPVGRLSVASTTSTGGTVTAWSNAYSIFGPNVGSTTGSALGLGYNTTTNLSEIISCAPNTAWRALGIFCGTLVFYSNAGTETMRIDSTGNAGIGTASPTALLDVNSNIFRLRTAKTPASATAAGNTGDICWDASYIYVCTATNTWKRVGIATW